MTYVYKIFKGSEYQIGVWIENLMKAAEMGYSATHNFNTNNMSIGLEYENVDIRKLIRKANKLMEKNLI